MDLIGPLPETRQGHKYVLTVVCCFTKWIESYRLKAISAKAVASTFVKEFICLYGLVKEIHTDQGRQIESELFQETCVLLGIEKTRTTAFYPASDGLVERVQRTIEDMLSKYVKSNLNRRRLTRPRVSCFWVENPTYQLICSIRPLQESQNSQ